MLLLALGGMVYSQPDERKPGPLNRALHQAVINLNGAVETDVIYRLLPTLWRQLTPAEQYACDELQDPCFPSLFAAYLYISTGQWDEARKTLAAATHKKRSESAARGTLGPARP